MGYSAESTRLGVDVGAECAGIVSSSDLYAIRDRPGVSAILAQRHDLLTCLIVCSRQGHMKKKGSPSQYSALSETSVASGCHDYLCLMVLSLQRICTQCHGRQTAHLPSSAVTFLVLHYRITLTAERAESMSNLPRVVT